MPKKTREHKTPSRTREHKTPSILVFVGALIVFITFIVKEGIAEKYKDSVTVLDEARSFFALREDIVHLRKLIVDAVSIEVPRSKAVIQEVYFLNESHPFIDDDLEAISQFMNRIDTGEDFSHRLDKLRQEFLQVERRDQQMLDEVRVTSGRRKTIDEIEAELTEMIPINNRNFQEYQLLKRDLIDAAERARDRDEHYHKIAKWAAIVFYTIGWCLGLVGKVYGLSGVEGAV